MHVHPHFPNLILHSNNELSELLGKTVSSRKTLHEWPLSCVQQLVLQDGSKLVYKTQLPPTVEPGFYEAAKTSLLPQYRLLSKMGQCETMTLEWIDAPLLSNVATEENSILAYGKAVIEQIGAIEGTLPVYLDIGSQQAWIQTVQDMCEKLQTLIQHKQFVLVKPPVIEQLQEWANSKPVIDAVGTGARVIHGDLKADQIFVTEDGFRVIDWQRPVMAPPETDLVSLLVEQHIDPRTYVNEAVTGIYWLLRLHWAVVAQADLFPGKRWPLFDQWAKEAVTQLF